MKMDSELPDPRDEPFSWPRSLAVAALAWAIFSLTNASQVYLSMLSHGHSYPRMIVFNLLVWSVWALFTPVVQLLGRRWPLIPFSWEALVRHLAAALALAAIHTAAWTELTIRIRPYDHMTIVEFDGNWANLLWVQAQGELLIYFVILGLSAAGAFARTLHRREALANRLERQLAEAKLHSLQLQLRPHFLFNTLNAISALVRGRRNPEAVEMIVRLSDLLHQTLATEPARWIPLQRELELLRAYLEIEAVRFSDRLSVSWEIDPAALAARVPPFLLQPLAENAVRHGIAKVAGPGNLAISARRAGPAGDAGAFGERLILEIENSGPPLAPATPGAGGVGLANCRERLLQLFGGAASLSLEDRPGAVLARIELPCREAIR